MEGRRAAEAEHRRGQLLRADVFDRLQAQRADVARADELGRRLDARILQALDAADVVVPAAVLDRAAAAETIQPARHWYAARHSDDTKIRDGRKGN